jgi:spore coat protein CotF
LKRAKITPEVLIMEITLTQKERMLLEDQKSHEQLCIQKYLIYGNQVSDNQLRQICFANGQSEVSHLDSLNQLLCGKLPQMDQQQSQTAQQSSGGAQTACFSDEDICKDLLATEKYVSGAYNTAIFEFCNTNVRDVLNHIQKEEQKHGEAISQYMISKGMYAVQ